MNQKRSKSKQEGHCLQLAKIENHSGWQIRPVEQIPPLRKGYYNILNISPGGDAPKDFIRVYEYGKARRNTPGKWQAWIAKVGQKWHPVESIMEYMLNRLGETLGLAMAESRLMRTGEQVRFLSKYFLRKGEQLIHGAEIYGGYLADLDFVEQVEKENLARDLFTFQFAEKAIKERFPGFADELLKEFVRLLVFDAIVGNNDRHFYNWGVITTLDGSETPRFAPIYDTARGMFWNDPERKIIEKLKNPTELNVYLKKYINKSLPKTGWEGENSINHFRFVERLYENDRRYRPICEELCNFAQQQNALLVIDNEFSSLLSRQRLSLIKTCLEMRFQRIRDIISKY